MRWRFFALVTCCLLWGCVVEGPTADEADGGDGLAVQALSLKPCTVDSQCVSTDICKVGACVNNECKYGPDIFKPECCHDSGDCDDKLHCNIDKCSKKMPGGWTQCEHLPAPDGQGPTGEPCCKPGECDDGNSCTWDFCGPNGLCTNYGVSGCCSKKDPLSCDDGNPCTLDECAPTKFGDIGSCKHKALPSCCTSDAECDDGLFCTQETCDKAKLTCKYTKNDPTCCESNKECSGFPKSCSLGWCVNHKCYVPKASMECCDTNLACMDFDDCTIDFCDLSEGICKFVAGVTGDPSCCSSNVDCDDGDKCTTDTCMPDHKCSFVADAQACCTSTGDCDDGDPCTIDSCKADKTCAHEFDSTYCCKSDSDCDDGNDCTVDYCLHVCRHTVPKDGCCASDKDCDDGDKCTTDKCELNGNTVGICSFPKSAGCSCCSPLNAATSCDDNNACTVEACADCSCTHTPKPDCCLDQFDCEDGLACTLDLCVFNSCWSLPPSVAEPCCHPVNEAIDCGWLDDDKHVGKCLMQPDGKYWCAKVTLGG